MSIENSNIKVELLKYHYDAMVKRRSIGYKAFLALITFYLLITKGFFDYRDYFSTPENFKILLPICYLLLLFIYGGFIFSIERSNSFNRKRYIVLEHLLLKENKIYINPCYCINRNKDNHKTSNPIWAMTYTILAGLLIAIGLSIAIWTF